MTIKVQGFRELEKALGEFKKATARGVANRALRKAAEPIAEAARAKVPVDSSALKDSIAVSPRLAKRGRDTPRGSLTTMHVGAGQLAQAHLVEFGGPNTPPKAYLRPAWDSSRQNLLPAIAEELSTEIDRAAKRVAARALRSAK